MIDRFHCKCQRGKSDTVDYEIPIQQNITFLLVDVKFEISKSTHNIYVCLLNDVDKDTGEATVSLRFFNDLSTSFVYKKEEIFAVDIMDIVVILTLLETTFQNRKIT